MGELVNEYTVSNYVVCLLCALTWIWGLWTGKFNYGPRVKIPFDVNVYPHPNPHDETWGHGPRRALKWYEVYTFRTGVNGNYVDTPRRWFYTGFGCFHVDWRWL